MEDNYLKAYKEVYEILKYVPKEDYQKIPEDLIKTIENNMDKNYEYKIDFNIDFSEQPMLRETMAIMAIIYRDYWADEKQREAIIKKQNYDIQKEEEKKKELAEETNLNVNKNEEEELSLVEYHKSWYIKFIEVIKKFLKKD